MCLNLLLKCFDLFLSLFQFGRIFFMEFLSLHILFKDRTGTSKESILWRSHPDPNFRRSKFILILFPFVPLLTLLDFALKCPLLQHIGSTVSFVQFRPWGLRRVQSALWWFYTLGQYLCAGLLLRGLFCTNLQFGFGLHSGQYIIIGINKTSTSNRQYQYQYQLL